MNCLKNGLAGLLLVILSSITYSQSLDEKYKSLLEKTETFKQYKVIPKASLDRFWGEVLDSTSVQNQTIGQLQETVTEQGQKITSLTQSLEEVQAQLDESQKKNDSIGFLGLSLSKFSYHLMVWILIFILTVLGLIAYAMYFRSNRFTMRHKKDLQDLERSFEKHKNAAREKQVKLKRELQTAINKLETKGKAIS